MDARKTGMANVKRRTFPLDGRHGVGGRLVTVIQHYAEAAYPRGGSACATAAREALESLAQRIGDEETTEISTRQRPMLKSAVAWYAEEKPEQRDDIHQRLSDQLETEKPHSRVGRNTR